MTITMLKAAPATSAFVLGSGLAAAQTPAPQPPPEPPPHAQMAEMHEVVLQGCLARAVESDTAGPSVTSPSAGTPAASAASRDATEHGGAVQAELFLLKHASKKDAAPSATREDATYRLIADTATVSLSAHVGHQIEVRGRMAGEMGGTGHAQAVQGGQVPGVGQAVRAGRTGATEQTGRSDWRMSNAQRPPVGGAFPLVKVTAVRMIAATCSSL